MLEQLRDVVEHEMRAWAIPGISIGLLHDDQTETATYGIASIETNAPVLENTLFQVGSISKIFTTTTVMSFVDET